MKVIVSAVFTVMLLVCSTAIEAEQPNRQLQATTVAEVLDEQINIVSENGDQIEDLEFHIPGSSFIKLHFSDFRPLPGVVVEVRNPSRTESYRYSRRHKDAYTFDPETGDDGIRSFSAMSISGDTVIIQVHNPGRFRSASKPADSGRIFVDHVVRGYSNHELKPQRSLPQSGKSKIADKAFIESSDGGGSRTQNSCGVNERFDTVCWAGSDPAAYDRSGPVAKIILGTSACTAWRVGPDNRMFTNHHCMSSKSAASATEVWFNYERSVCGGDATEPVVKVSGDKLLATDNTLDYSLFTVKDFGLIESFGNLGLEVREVVLDEEIYIPQHGAGDPKQLSIESDMNIGGVCRVDVENHTGFDVGTDVGYYCDTAGGSSGSPVVTAGSNKAIALHHFGGCLNSGVKMSLIWPKVRRHFNRVVPEGDYSGAVPDPDPLPNSAPTALFSFACNGLSCSFNGNSSSDSDGSIVGYSWSFGDGANAGSASASHSFATAGSYGVTLVVTDNDGSTGSRNQQVEVVSASGSQLELSAAGGKNKGGKWADLSWSGSTTSTVRIYRDGALLSITENAGTFRDQSLAKNTKLAIYKVCENSGPVCSSEAEVRF